MRFKLLLTNILLFAFLLILESALQAQKPVSKAMLLKKINEPPQKTTYISYLKKSNNTLQGSGAILFIGYKTFISSQDMASCIFTPSCSVYAIESFQSDNPFLAYVKVFDRLSRCHPLTAKGEYPYYKKTAQFYDPVH